MLTYVLVSIGSGFILAFFDIVIYANPLGRKIYAPYKPIARDKVSPILLILTNIAFGFTLAGFYLIIYRVLPGPTGLFRALVFGFYVWLIRSLMSSMSQWTAFKIPANVHLYTILAGLIQISTLSIFYLITLDPIAG